MQIITADAAAALLRDGMTVSASGFGGCCHPEAITAAVERRFLAEGAPRDLTLLFAASTGDRKTRGMGHFGFDGLVKCVIAGGWRGTPRLGALALADRIEAHCWPQGVIAQIYRAIAAGQPGVVTRIGLGSFMDPAQDGGALNAVTTPLVERVQLRGRDWLLYPAMPLDCVLLRGTTADKDGNVTMEDEAFPLDVLAMAQAARNSGGIVIVQVKRIAARGSLLPGDVRIPGGLVDHVVVCDDPAEHGVSFGETDNIGYTGRVRVAAHQVQPLPLGVDKVIQRRAFRELLAMDRPTINLGIGIPAGIGKIAREEGYDDYTITIESGVVGGIPAEELSFGAATNPSAIIPQASQFDYYDGGGIDIAFLGMAEVDAGGHRQRQPLRHIDRRRGRLHQYRADLRPDRLSRQLLDGRRGDRGARRAARHRPRRARLQDRGAGGAHQFEPGLRATQPDRDGRDRARGVPRHRRAADAGGGRAGGRRAARYPRSPAAGRRHRRSAGDDGRAAVRRGADDGLPGRGDGAMNLDGAVVIVTGSATGVGAASVARFAERGARVVVNYTRSKAEAEATADTCRARGVAVEIVQADVADNAACRAMVQTAVARWGRLDALVNNAGRTVKSDPFDLETLSAEDFHDVFAVNVIGAYQMCRAAIPAMRANGGGAIVNVSSNVAFTRRGQLNRLYRFEGRAERAHQDARADLRAGDPRQCGLPRPDRYALDARRARPRGLCRAGRTLRSDGAARACCQRGRRGAGDRLAGGGRGLRHGRTPADRWRDPARGRRPQAHGEILMRLTAQQLVDFTVPDATQTVRASDAILYALSTGYGTEPCDAAHLRHIYEDGLVATPTLANVTAHHGPWMKAAEMDWGRVVHSEQRLVIHRPIPLDVPLISRARCLSVVDRGAAKGMFAAFERRIATVADDLPLATILQTNAVPGRWRLRLGRNAARSAPAGAGARGRYDLQHRASRRCRGALPAER